VSGCGNGVSGVSSGSVGSVGGGSKKPKEARRGEDGVCFGAIAHFHPRTHS